MEILVKSKKTAVIILFVSLDEEKDGKSEQDDDEEKCQKAVQDGTFVIEFLVFHDYLVYV